MSSSAIHISIEQAHSQYGITLKYPVAITPLQATAALTTEVTKRLLGAIGTFDLKWEQHEFRQEILEKNPTTHEKVYANQARIALNQAIDRMQSLFEETGFADVSLKNTQRIVDPFPTTNHLLELLMANYPSELQMDLLFEEQAIAILNQLKYKAMYEQIL